MSSAYPKPVEASIAATEWPLIADSLRQIWPSVCAAARAYLAYFPHRASTTDRLRVHLRPDSGNVFFAVCATPPRDFYGEVASVNIPFLESEYFKLVGDRSETGHEHDELMMRLASAIKSSCFAEMSPLTVTIVEYDDLETERLISPSDRNE
jgi:hypothetical protein